MADIVHRVGIQAPAARVYEALATVKGLAGWWTEETSGSDKVGGRILFQFRSKAGELIGDATMEVRELTPAQRVAWKCVGGPEEWMGTDVTFDLSEKDGMTIVLFGHKNWRETVEFTYHCSMKWAVFLLSLRDLVETGKGRPSPNDGKIDDWN